ncbi:MAG: glycerophosphodiester phosphodiesterase family protein [Cellvibrionaceae bacterium]
MNPNKLPSECLVAHRGHQSAFPENSILAVLDAIAAGAKKIEFDIQFTQDGGAALYHDEDMQRISGVDKKITTLTRQELTAYSSSEPKRLAARFCSNPIEYLDDLLPIIEKHHHIQFFLELKEESLRVFGDDACFGYLSKVLQPMPDNLVFISFDLPAVKRAKSEGFRQTALVFRDWDRRNSLLAESKADFGFINYTRIPLKEDIEADKPILVYEVKHQLIAKQLLDRGAAAVETFFIRSLLNNL